MKGEGAIPTSTAASFRYNCCCRAVAQVVARFLGVEEVAGSSPAGPTSATAGLVNRAPSAKRLRGTPVRHQIAIPGRGLTWGPVLVRRRNS